MFNQKEFLLGIISAALASTYAYAGNPEHNTAFYNNLLTQSHILELKPILSNNYQTASLQFLPELRDSEFGFHKNTDLNFNKGNNCDAYTFTKANCTRNRTTYNKCPFNSNNFKDCYCNATIYKYSPSNCSYSGTAHDANYMLGSNRCLDDNKPPRSNDCLCNERFSYTTNASCGDVKKIIDTSSSCTEDGNKRYEKCKCDPAKFPYFYTGGNSYSSGFKNAVKAKCRHPDNFYSCDNNGPTVYFNCAVTDSAYKYTSSSCSAEKSSWVVSGSSRYITNGNGIGITLYTICDCPSSYKSGSQCSYYMSRTGYESTSTPFCYEHGHGKRDGSKSYFGKRCIDMNGGTLYSDKSCTTRAGTTVYSDAASDCLCNRSIYTTIGERCYEYHKFSRQWCWVCKDRTGTYSYRH